MITLSIMDLKSKKVTTKCFVSLDKAKQEGQNALSKKNLRIHSASYDNEDEKSIVENLLKAQEAQEGFVRL